MNKNDNLTHKLTDEQFTEILIENGGLPSKTARAIKAKYKINYTRQAVSERAKKFPDILTECREEILEMAEDNLRHLLNCDELSEKRKITVYVLNCLGKTKGYGIAPANDESQEPETCFEIDGKEIHF